MTRAFGREGEGKAGRPPSEQLSDSLIPARPGESRWDPFGSVTSAERQQADMFLADLLGPTSDRPQRVRSRRPMAVPRPPIAAAPVVLPPIVAVPSIARSIAARRPRRAPPNGLAGVFDRMVHGSGSGELAESVEGEWEAVAYPGSHTPATSLQHGDVVVQRALAEGRLAFSYVVGEEIEAESLYGGDGRIREDMLVLRRRTDLGGGMSAEGWSSAEDAPSAEYLSSTEDFSSAEGWPSSAEGWPASTEDSPAEGWPSSAEGWPSAEDVVEDVLEQAPRTFTAARFNGNPNLSLILNDQRELIKTSPTMRGTDIAAVQQALVDLGYRLPQFGVDGIYRSETEAAVRKFQDEQRRLNPAFQVDGIVGDQTLGRLDEMFAVLDRPCGRPTAAPIDPTSASVAQPGRLTYDVGTASVLGVTLRVRGTIFYPAQAAGSAVPFSSAVTGAVPIIFIAHGNHGTFHNPADRTDEDSFQHPGWIPIANHDGYVYLQETLARLGFVSVSVDCNGTNGTGLTPTNIRQRSGLIVESVRHLLSLARAGSGSVLSGRIDFGRTGLLGHSRGGEAVLVVPGDLAAGGPTFASVNVRGVFSLAPTDAGTLAAMPTGFPYAVLLPAGDGDVRTNAGARFYDRIAPNPFKTQLYVHRTNHNRFNREWVRDDFATPIMSRPDHERLLTVYASAFFRQALSGVDFADILLGRTQVTGVSNDDIHISAERSGFVTVDDHEDVPVPPATRTTTNTLGGATTVLPNVSAVEIPFSQPGVAPNNRFFGATRGMVAVSAEPYGGYRSALPALVDMTNHEVWIRACEVFDGAGVPPGATQFQVGVEDTAGEVSFVASGPLPRPFDRTAVDAFTKNVPKTVRFGHTCFALARPGVDIRRIRAIHIRLTGTVGRRLGFDQLQVA
jgi:hypothetical protein